MLKLIIVDDERVIRETIASLIDWESLDIILAGSCKDGIEAYNMLLDESPDIVMTDIRMPGLSGLELIAKASQADLQIQFILLSGYEEFEYAREAMKYGVKHYLLKPCDEEQIMDSILQAKEDCMEIRRRKAERQRQDSMLRTIWQDTMYHLITVGVSEGIGSREEFTARWEKFSELYECGTIFLQKNDWKLFYLYYMEPEEKERMLIKLQEEGEENQDYFYGVYVKNTLLLFFREEKWGERIRRICGEEFSDVEIKEETYTDLFELYDRILKKISRYDRIQAVHNFSVIPILNNQGVLNRIRKILQEFVSCSAEKRKDLCGELKLLMEGATSLEFARMLAGNISISLADMDVLSMSEATEFAKDIAQRQQAEEIGERTLNLINTARETLDKASCGYGSLADRIIEYMKEHLSDPNLTLKQIAQQELYMNVDYVSRQFQRATGVKFSQFLTELRVNRAKELLLHEETNKIQYVAMQVGCGNNARYFSQIFKKTVGKTPSAWAEDMRRKTD